MGFLGSLFGRGRQADILVIDYEHQSGGAFYHGTISLAGGNVIGGWTVDDGKDKKTQKVAMTGETFKSIWDSMNEIPDFKAGLVSDPDQQLDPSTNHIVSALSTIDGEEKTEIYIIPDATASPAFREWLDKIGYTGK
jgi:hypothetical protein